MTISTTAAMAAQAALEKARPWDLKIEVEGKEYAVRRLENADIARLRDVGAYTHAQNVEAIAGLFDGAPPPTLKTDPSLADVVTLAITTYYVETVLKKKAATLREQFSQQIAAEMASIS